MGERYAESASFVVRVPGRWVLTTVPVSEPRDLELSELCTVLSDAQDAGGSHWGTPSGGGRIVRLPDDRDEVSPSWMFVALCTTNGLAIEDGAGGLMLLEPDDLRILDALDAPVPVVDLLAAVGGEAEAQRARIAQMAAGGRVLQVTVAPPTEQALGADRDASPATSPETDEQETAHDGEAQADGDVGPAGVAAADPPAESDRAVEPGTEVQPVVASDRGPQPRLPWQQRLAVIALGNPLSLRLRRAVRQVVPRSPTTASPDDGLSVDQGERPERTAEVGPVEPEPPQGSDEHDDQVDRPGDDPPAEPAAMPTVAHEEHLEGPATPVVVDAPEARPDVAAEQAHPIESGTGADDRIPVFAVWHDDTGPLLSLGMLTAASRHWEDGRLTRRFEIRRPERADVALQAIGSRSGPVVLLCSDYVWSLERNLEVARRAIELNPRTIVVHGGPSCPTYERDVEEFIRVNGDVAHVLVHGEGERTLVELLDHIADNGGSPNPGALAGIAGITFVDAREGRIVTTAPRDRMAELDQIPSPYLTGEFDGIDPEAWPITLSLESNRGCPYGCTFCDWGSATMSRIRKFDLNRVLAEIEWAGANRVRSIFMNDANFGILSRDVQIAERVADVKRRTGYPLTFTWAPAKNTTKHLIKIVKILDDAGFPATSTLGLQTVDPSTLDVIDRNNISTDRYMELVAEFRRLGLSFPVDLMLGLPGQTVASYKADIQFMLVHEIKYRTWPVQLLPNSPMNEPSYRELHRIRADDRGIVVSAATFTESDRLRMYRLRKCDVIAERMGLFRYLMRHLQWDHGILGTDLEEHIIDVVGSDPDRFPLLTWVIEYFDLFPTVPLGWTSLYLEMRSMLHDDLGLELDPAVESVVRLQEFLMPAPGRQFPASITLAHDVAAYYGDATSSLRLNGSITPLPRPLSDYPPATFTIDGDPLGVCTHGIELLGSSRDDFMQGDFYCLVSTFDLDSPLGRDRLADEQERLTSAGTAPDGGTDGAQSSDDELVPARTVTAVPVTLGPSA